MIEEINNSKFIVFNGLSYRPMILEECEYYIIKDIDYEICDDLDIVLYEIINGLKK